MRFGVDVLLEDPTPLRGKRLGVVVNAASVTRDLVPTVDALRAAGLEVVRAFGPEHGFTGAAQDMEAVCREVGTPRGTPTVSLYGQRFEDLSPKAEHLDGLDAVVCDLPDVGSRYYTFVWTTALVMKACAPRGLPVWVLDRPNPLGGAAVEGNLPDDDGLLSFVGLHPVPPRHGLTPAEMARLVDVELGLGCALTAVPMGETRGDLGGSALPWVLPSPNMPARETAVVYPGGCLVEGTNLSEGRGTTKPFELVGAPGLDAGACADAANALGMPGVVFRPHVFKPTFQKHAGTPCGGVQVHVTDRDAFRPYETYLRLLAALHDLAPGTFVWRRERYEYRDDVPAIDLLAGTRRYRDLVDRRESLDAWIAGFERDERAFRERRAPHLLYPARDGHPPVLQLVGAHDSGKTTLAEALIVRLTARGVRVGSVKQTPHEYETDAAGKDSARHGAAGANPALLIAGRRRATHRRESGALSLRDLLRAEMRHVDLVVVEGGRDEAFAKVEVSRSATGRPPVAPDDPTVLAVFADRETPHAAAIARHRLDDVDALTAIAERLAGLA